MVDRVEPVVKSRWADLEDDSEPDGIWQNIAVRNAKTKEDMVPVLTQIEPEESRTARARRICLISGVHEEDIKQVVTELYTPQRANARIRKSGARSWIRAGISFDLVVNEDTG